MGYGRGGYVRREVPRNRCTRSLLGESLRTRDLRRVVARFLGLVVCELPARSELWSISVHAARALSHRDAGASHALHPPLRRASAAGALRELLHRAIRSRSKA